MENTDILLRVVENLLDENKRLRQELAKTKVNGAQFDIAWVDEATCHWADFFNGTTAPPKYKAKRSRIVNDPTDMIKGVQELIEKFEEERLKDNEKHDFPKGGFVPRGESITPCPYSTLEKHLKIFSELRKLQQEIEDHLKNQKKSKS